MKEGVDVAVTSERGKQKEMKNARNALLGALSLLQYLIHQDLAALGNGDAEGNLTQLLELRASGIPESPSWLCRTKYMCISHESFNKMLEIRAHGVLR